MKIDKQISSWARAVYMTIEENPDKIEEIFSNLRKSLGESKMKYYSVIVKKALQLYEKETKAELVLSTSFDEETKKSIKGELREHFNDIDRITERVDESLIAGFRLKTKNILIKASLKDVLIGLKNKTYGHN